jgi:hypothetical protein
MPFASVDAAAVDMIDGSTKQPRRKHKADDDHMRYDVLFARCDERLRVNATINLFPPRFDW